MKQLPFVFLFALALARAGHGDQLSELLTALSSNRLDRAEELLSANPALIDQTTSDWRRDTPLTAAARDDNCQAITYLLGRGASVTNRNGRGETPLMAAVCHESTNALGTLLQHPQPPSVLVHAFSLGLQCDKTASVLCILSFTNHVAALKAGNMLFFHGLVRVAPPPRAWLPPKHQRVAMIRLLREKGLDPSRTNKNGKTAADLAAENKDIEALRLLDVSRKYDQLLRAFTPATNSPFIGAWSNEKYGSGNFGFQLGADGKGAYGSADPAVDGIPIYWSQNGDTVEMFFPANAATMFPGGSLKARRNPADDTLACVDPWSPKESGEKRLYRCMTQGERDKAKARVLTFPDPNFERAVRAAVADSVRRTAFGGELPPRGLYEEDAKVLDVLRLPMAGITNLAGIREFSALEELQCYDNSLRSLDVSGLLQLQDLVCSRNPLTNLNVSGCANLQVLECSRTSLTNLDLSGCPKLRELDCTSAPVTHLNLTGCTNVETLFCGDVRDSWEVAYYLNRLKDLSLSCRPNLTTVMADHNSLTNLDVSGCSKLEELNCSYNQGKLARLDVSNCVKLRCLRCVHSGLTGTLDLSTCTNLVAVYAVGNRLSEIVLANTNSPPKEFAYDPGVVIRQK